MSIYVEAAKVIHGVKAKTVSIKSSILGGNTNSKSKKQLYALVCGTLKYECVIKELLEAVCLLKREKNLQGYLAYPLVYDLLFGKGLRKGQKHQAAVLKHKNALRAALARIKIKANAIQNEDLLAKHVKEHMRLPRYVRVNSLKATKDLVVNHLQQEGYKFVKNNEGISFERFKDIVCELRPKEFTMDIHIPDLLVFPSGTDLHDHPLYRNGSIILQDKASCLPAFLLEPPPGSKVIDACAAPGNKSSYLASLMSNNGIIFAVDADAKRLETMSRLMSTAGVTCTRLINADFLSLNPDNKMFEEVQYILVDPSCSGSGIVNRLDYLVDKEEVPSAERLERLSNFQLAALKHALSFPNVRRVTYSTCSIYEEENESLVHAAMSAFSGKFYLKKLFPKWEFRGKIPFKKADCFIRASPEDTLTNGFFVAVFERRSTQSL